MADGKAEDAPYDARETRDPEHRRADQEAALRVQVAHAKAKGAYWADAFADVVPEDLTYDTLAALPVTRKSDLIAAQADAPPFGGLNATATADLARLFLSPGPIADPEGFGSDWWRFARALHAAGFRKGDIVLNSFSYHMTPAGHMFESAAHALGLPVIPGGVGNSEGQAEAAAFYGATAYAGTPDFLGTLLDKADAAGRPLAFAKAMVSAGPLFPSMREAYRARGIATLQSYGTADLGLVAYESAAMDGMLVDEDVIVEIVRPGTGERVSEGEVGEVVVTLLANREYPLIRFATGDLSAALPGPSPCGRTAPRIKGWMGRADQTTKVRGMFVRPEQVAALVGRHPEIARARVVVSSDADKRDVMTVRCEATSDLDAAALAESVSATLKLKGAVEIVAPDTLPNDGKVIEDARDFDG